MKKEWLVKTLAMVIVVLFISVSYQPIIAENTTSVGKESSYNNLDFEEAKEYLFHTIIDISNNPDVKELFKQLKYNQRIFTSDYDYKSVFSQLFLKKPELLLSILFTKPKMTYEYINQTYNRGIKCVNILGEKQALDMTDSIKISNPDLLNELNNIIKNDKELSNRISTLEIMNNDLELDSPFKGRPIICICLLLICIPLLILLLFSSLLMSIFEKNPDLIQRYPALFNWAEKYIFVSSVLISYSYSVGLYYCYY
jgi:hypothetical protein